MRLILLLIAFSIANFAHADFSTHRKYKDVTAFIQDLAQKYPSTTRLITIGSNNSGVAIEALQIGSGAIRNLVVAAHHGNEYGSTELALHFAEALAINPIANQTVFVIPVLNIDGYNQRGRYERVNGRAIDLNRDYPGPCGSEGPFHSSSSKALADFVEQKNIIVSATIHTYWPAVVYPWGISTEDIETPYTSVFQELAEAATAFSRYTTGNGGQVIYPADGCFEDYAYWKHGIWSLLFEVGRSHNPSLGDLEEMVRSNVPGLRKMFETAPQVRAANHNFTGECSAALKAMDLHLE